MQRRRSGLHLPRLQNSVAWQLQLGRNGGGKRGLRRRVRRGEQFPLLWTLQKPFRDLRLRPVGRGHYVLEPDAERPLRGAAGRNKAIHHSEGTQGPRRSLLIPLPNAQSPQSPPSSRPDKASLSCAPSPTTLSCRTSTASG